MRLQPSPSPQEYGGVELRHLHPPSTTSSWSLTSRLADMSKTFHQLFSPVLRRITLLLWVVWIGFGWAYYGCILIMPEVLPLNKNGSTPAADDTSAADNINYPALFINSLAEVVAWCIAMYLVERVSRRALSVVTYIGCGIFLALVAIESPQGVRLFLTMMARGCIFIASCTTWIITPELYPTSVRAAGHSWANGVARIGAFSTSYWGDATSIPLAGRLMFYAVVSAVAGVASWALPRETKGRALD